MSDWESDDYEKTYRAGGESGYAAVAGVVLGIAAIGWSAWRLWERSADGFDTAEVWFFALLGLGLVGVGVYSMMQVRNARVRLSDAGLVVQDWRKARRLIPWDSILAVIWRNIRTGPTGSTYWLVLCTEHARGRRHRINIGCGNYSDPEKIRELRDEIISRRDLSEAHDNVPPILWRIVRLLGIREIRIWRQDDLIR